ncbi:basic proline-rich protein-like [Dama dama]|uniref:basic proline-rich protein-like n=1 Tax=Dama dama TaxID=30532 RepID=UPI002A367FFF|nr:basic proline-rich protein-like [Dama dama]
MQFTLIGLSYYFVIVMPITTKDHSTTTGPMMAGFPEAPDEDGDTGRRPRKPGQAPSYWSLRGAGISGAPRLPPRCGSADRRDPGGGRGGLPPQLGRARIPWRDPSPRGAGEGAPSPQANPPGRPARLPGAPDAARTNLPPPTPHPRPGRAGPPGDPGPRDARSGRGTGEGAPPPTAKAARPCFRERPTRPPPRAHSQLRPKPGGPLHGRRARPGPGGAVPGQLPAAPPGPRGPGPSPPPRAPPRPLTWLHEAPDAPAQQLRQDQRRAHRVHPQGRPRRGQRRHGCPRRRRFRGTRSSGPDGGNAPAPIIDPRDHHPDSRTTTAPRIMDPRDP